MAHQCAVVRSPGAVATHEAAHRLGDKIKRWSIRIGAALAKTTDARLDDARSQRRQAGPIKAHICHHARAEIVNDHVGSGQESSQHFPAACTPQIEHQRPLIAIKRRKIPAQAFDHDALRAQRIPSGWLDLQYLGAHIGQ